MLHQQVSAIGRGAGCGSPNCRLPLHGLAKCQVTNTCACGIACLREDRRVGLALHLHLTSAYHACAGPQLQPTSPRPRTWWHVYARGSLEPSHC